MAVMEEKNWEEDERRRASPSWKYEGVEWTYYIWIGSQEAKEHVQVA